MAKLVLDFTARNNEDWAWSRQFISGGQPLPLPGEPRMSVIDAQGRIVLDLRVNAGLVVDAPNGLLGARVPAQVMKGLPAGTYTHDIQFRAGTVTETPIVGTVTVEQGVTRV